MPFVWVTFHREIEGGEALRTSRALINTDQIAVLEGRALSMSDAETYSLSLVSANELIRILYDPSNALKESGFAPGGMMP